MPQKGPVNTLTHVQKVRTQDDAVSESDEGDELCECGVQVRDEVMTVQSRYSPIAATLCWSNSKRPCIDTVSEIQLASK